MTILRFNYNTSPEIFEESIELQSNNRFDNVKLLKTKKPDPRRSGLNDNPSSVKLDNKPADKVMLPESPNLYKQNGGSMSKIPYNFITPVPKYFQEKGLFKNEKTWKFVTWAFSKCSNHSWTIDYENDEITLQPYEFICGRNKSSAECFLTPKEFRGQLDSLRKRGLIQKGANSKANRYSTYIWVTSRFSEVKGQPKGQLTGQPRANPGPQSRRLEDKEDKKNHPSPSFEKKASDEVIDDDFSKEKKEFICKGEYPDDKKTKYEVWLSEEEIQRCLRVHKTREGIINQIEQIVKCPERTTIIKKWAYNIVKWKFSNVLIDRSKENEAWGRNLEDIYKNPNNAWGIEHYRDNIKDASGTLFYSQGGQNEKTYFIHYTDQDYEKKVLELIEKLKIKKSGTK